MACFVSFVLLASLSNVFAYGHLAASTRGVAERDGGAFFRAQERFGLSAPAANLHAVEEPEAGESQDEIDKKNLMAALTDFLTPRGQGATAIGPTTLPSAIAVANAPTPPIAPTAAGIAPVTVPAQDPSPSRAAIAQLISALPASKVATMTKIVKQQKEQAQMKLRSMLKQLEDETEKKMTAQEEAAKWNEAVAAVNAENIARAALDHSLAMENVVLGNAAAGETGIPATEIVAPLAEVIQKLKAFLAIPDIVPTTLPPCKVEEAADPNAAGPSVEERHNQGAGLADSQAASSSFFETHSLDDEKIDPVDVVEDGAGPVGESEEEVEGVVDFDEEQVDEEGEDEAEGPLEGEHELFGDAD
eukprot:TRINITY_DN67468_c0_g1_i1.p1 TRINITY_DN67468_c0_g1~~TRINITY_DN67468_c0_g1_i1.p1  ORF type:complete len:386 (-),score=81.26 TRINITY_DN67468_c0_g1_i1:293-1372(-)